MRIYIETKPLSQNMYYNKFRNRIIISKEGQEYRKNILDAINNQDKIYGDIIFKVVCSFKDRRKRDLDNILKPLIDCLKNVVFEDDDRIIEIQAKKIITDKEYLEIEISNV